MLLKFVFSMLMTVLLGVAVPVSAKPPPDDDKKAEWYFFIIHGSQTDVFAFRDEYDIAYNQGGKLKSLCDEKLYIFPHEDEAAAGFLCDKHPDSVGAVAAVLLTLASPSMQLNTSNPCGGWFCPQGAIFNCTRYTCYGVSACYHYGYPCVGTHKCKQ
jgi:hypothetical protein